jgi:hypothetical protein
MIPFQETILTCTVLISSCFKKNTIRSGSKLKGFRKLIFAYHKLLCVARSHTVFLMLTSYEQSQHQHLCISLIMFKYVLSLFVFLIFCILSHAERSKFYKEDVENNDKMSNINLDVEYHSVSLAYCSAVGSWGYFGFNSKEKKCRVYTCCPTTMTGSGEGWMYYISTNPDPGLAIIPS